MRLVGAKEGRRSEGFLQFAQIQGGENAFAVVEEDMGKIAKTFDAHDVIGLRKNQPVAGGKSDAGEGFFSGVGDEVVDLFLQEGKVRILLNSADGRRQFVGIDGFEQVVDCVVAESPDGKIVVGSGEDYVETHRRNLIEQIEARAVFQLYVEQQQVGRVAAEQRNAFRHAPGLAGRPDIRAVFKEHISEVCSRMEFVVDDGDF